jgi:hypothetical protein
MEIILENNNMTTSNGVVIFLHKFLFKTIFHLINNIHNEIISR